MAAIVARLVERGLDVSVVSRGEWELARRAGVPDASSFGRRRGSLASLA